MFFMDVEGDVHVGGMLLGERCTYSGAGPEALQGLEWWYVQLGRTRDSGPVVPGVWNTGPTHEKRVHILAVPNSA